MKIKIETTINAPVDDVWEAWIKPEHIVKWNFASADWHCPGAELDLTAGGKFNYRMEARNGSMGFDFKGTFTAIDPVREIKYSLDDDREVTVSFQALETGVRVVETFDAENELSGEQQRQGWQSILDNFKSHVEANCS